MEKKKIWQYTDGVLHDGFKNDFEQFLNLFRSKKSVNYETFTEVWNETKFHLLYSGLDTVPFVEEFTEEISAFILKEALNEMTDEYAKVCCVYMLYAFYHKQPCGIKPSVRVIKKDVPLLVKLKQQLRNPEHLQVQYVLCSLLRDGFFRFVITPHPYGLEKSYRKNLEEAYSIASEKKQMEKITVSNELNELVNSSDIGLRVMEKVFEEYYNAKLQLPGSSKIEPPRELQLVDKDVPKILIDSYRCLKEGENAFYGNKEIILRKDQQGSSSSNKHVASELSMPSTSAKMKKKRVMKADSPSLADESLDSDDDEQMSYECRKDMPAM